MKRKLKYFGANVLLAGGFFRLGEDFNAFYDPGVEWLMLGFLLFIQYMIIKHQEETTK